MRGERLAGALHDPHADSAPSEAPDHTESAIVGAEDERAGRHGQPSARAIARATAGAANSAPATNRSSGAELHAAGAPTKCRPSAVDSRPRLSFGWPSPRATRATSSGARKGYCATSTL